MKKLDFSEEEIRELYEKKKLTTFQIADKLDCCQATVWKRLKDFGIKPRPSGTKRVNISKEKLFDLYVSRNLSSWKIEEKLKIPRSTVHRKLKNFGLIKDRATAHIVYPRKDFSGDLSEKSYLIGFRIGDLRVRKSYAKGKTICLACSSTIPEQIDLITDLFEKYGRVWIKRSKDGKIIHSEVYLNDSFEFLISKQVPKWVFKFKKYFFSFLSGFIDAEGHIGVYRGMAKFSLGNYDSDILFMICDNLNKYGIVCRKPTSDSRKGKLNNQGYRYNQNYWQLSIHKKRELEKLFDNLKLYIKHKKKIKALNIAIENIKLRERLRSKNEK